MKKTAFIFLSLFLFISTFTTAHAKSEKRFTDSRNRITFICGRICPEGMRQRSTHRNIAENYANHIDGEMKGKFRLRGRGKTILAYIRQGSPCVYNNANRAPKGRAYSFITSQDEIAVCLNTTVRKIQKYDTTIIQALAPWYSTPAAVASTPASTPTLPANTQPAPPPAQENSTAHLIAPPNATLENNIIIVCADPCPAQFTPAALEKIKRDFSWQMSYLEKAVGYTLPDSRKPFEVHLTHDRNCNREGGIPDGTRAFTSINKTGKGYICLLVSPSEIIANKTAFLHELSHHYFLYYTPELYPVLEEIVTGMTSLALAPGNHWLYECNPNLANTRGIHYAYKLCLAGLTQSRVGELARLFRAIENQALLEGRLVNLAEFRKMLEEMLGKDLSEAL